MGRQDIDTVLTSVWDWSSSRDFKGYNKHDGLNSPVLHGLLGWGKWPRIIAIQLVMRSPVNIRPLLGVQKVINPKGLALFSLGSLDRYQTGGEMDYLQQAESLLEMLLKNRSRAPSSEYCWGYHYPWQDPGFYAPPKTPNAVVTCFVCEAFLEAYRLTGKKEYLDVVEKAADFFLNDLTVLLDEPDRLCLGYMPLPMTMKVMDVSILIGAVLAQLVSLGRRPELADTARRLVTYVVDRQTDYGAWYYTDPPEDSHIRHDNYHTGFILDALWRYMEATDDWCWKIKYEKGLAFYADKLFNPDGSPRWMSDRDYPHDIHGAAQGLVSFGLAVRNGYNYRVLLDKIGTWSLDNMYDPEGRFYYQQGRRMTKKFTLLRWCNAWMFRGLVSWRRALV
ncbi:MAG: hypothetical protein ACLFV2_01910 [Desulfurivibrionaceae bacterium]